MAWYRLAASIDTTTSAPADISSIALLRIREGSDASTYASARRCPLLLMLTSQTKRIQTSPRHPLKYPKTVGVRLSLASPKNWRNFWRQAVSHLSIITYEPNQ